MRFIKSLFSVVLCHLTLLGVTGCADEPDAATEEPELVVDPVESLRASSQDLSSSSIQPSASTFVGHGGYVAANVPLAPIAKLRTALETTLGTKLKNRGEAHVTTITPPELSVLSRRLPASSIEATARARGIQAARIIPKCIGIGTSGRDRTFYLVVESTDLVAIRQAVLDEYVQKGGAASDFAPSNFQPHVTLGFTSRDLFESDGVKKSVESCPRHDNLNISE